MSRSRPVVKVYREEQAKTAPAHVKDTRLFTRILRAIWIVTCFVIFGYAFVVLFFSPNMYTYLTQRETFYTIAITGTVIYFVTAYWELRRQKAFANQAASEGAAKGSQAGEAVQQSWRGGASEVAELRERVAWLEAVVRLQQPSAGS